MAFRYRLKNADAPFLYGFGGVDSTHLNRRKIIPYYGNKMSVITIEKVASLKVDQKACAKIQDRVIGVLFGSGGLPDAVLHGGAQIWRCYDSRRFSCDVDIYSQMTNVQARLVPAFEDAGLVVVKFRDTGNVVFAKLTSTENGKEHSSGFEIRRAPVEGEIAAYTNTDGSTTEVIAISPNAIALEKIAAYVGRAEIRDMYDLYHIIRSVIGRENVSAVLSSQLSNFTATLQRPVNEGDLGRSLYSGNIPTFVDMVTELRKATRKE